MKDEIKEILDKFDKVLENYELDKKWGQMSVDSICHLFPSEMVAIKDYITNLQEENEHLDKVNCQLRKKINNDIYKSRNEKAIEYNKKNIKSETLNKILQGEDKE